MTWLKNLQPPKPCRYLYYRLYSYAIETGNTTPKLSAAITLAFSHLLQITFCILTLGAIMKKDFWGMFFTNTNKVVLVIFLLAFLYVIELFYQYGGKSEKYIGEFKNETNKKRRSGTIFLFVYFIISIPVFLVLSAYIIISFSPFYQ